MCKVLTVGKKKICIFVLNFSHASDPHDNSEFCILSQNKKATSFSFKPKYVNKIEALAMEKMLVHSP